MASNRVTLRLARALLLVSLVGAACSAPPAPAPTAAPAQDAAPAGKPAEAAKPAPQATAAGAEATPAAKAAEPVAAPSKPAQEQVLRLPLAEPPTLDPGLATDSVSVDIIAQIFEGLVAYDDKGTISGLGAEKWDISPDGLTYTFTLRQGPQWSDGKPVTAKDYEWAWKRNVDPKTASDYATTLYPIKNAVKIHKEGLEPNELGVVARDDRTLVVTLEQPASYFLRLASTWTMMPLRGDVIDKFGDKWTEAQNVVTNGPFLLREWQHDTQIVLERNDKYWGEKPSLNRAIYRLFPEGGSEQVLTAYEAGELDTVGPGTSFELPAAQVDRVLADPKLKEEVKTFGQSATMFITVNNRREHLKDPRVRMALGQAIERQRLLDQVLKRVGTPAFSLQPEGIVGRQPDLWPKEDLQQAKKNLADAGFPDGKGFPEITFTYNTSDQWKLLAEHLQQRYKEALGINLKLDSMEFATFLKWRRGDEWADTGDLFRGGWFSDYEDPNNWYNVLWDSREDPEMFNSGWKNEEYDRLVRQAQGELDPGARERLYRQAEEILAREYPNIPIFHYSIRTLVKPYVQNFEPERVLGITPLKRIKLAERR
jgi:oligopeptide transport system substrate-binding protein